jgi:hypothetical protein
VEKYILKMPVRWRSGEGYVTSGVDLASERNQKSADQLGINIDEFHALMSIPQWALTVLGVRDEHPDWDITKIQYEAIGLMFHGEKVKQQMTMGELIAQMLRSR